jgi:hypothetical protein
MPDIKYSAHARKRMVERGISPVEVRDAINRGSKSADGKLITSAYRHLKVVFKKSGDDWYVITVMLRW